MRLYCNLPTRNMHLQYEQDNPPSLGETPGVGRSDSRVDSQADWARCRCHQPTRSTGQTQTPQNTAVRLAGGQRSLMCLRLLAQPRTHQKAVPVPARFLLTPPTTSDALAKKMAKQSLESQASGPWYGRFRPREDE